GTPQSPFRVETTVHAENDSGPIGLEVKEVDTYVIGNEYFQTDLTVSNTSPDTTFTDLKLYHSADCYLQDSDRGFGFLDTSNDAIACSQNPNNSPQGRVEEFAPLTPGSHYVEAGFGAVNSDVRSQAALPDTCDCDVDQDNGMG